MKFFSQSMNYLNPYILVPKRGRKQNDCKIVYNFKATKMKARKKYICSKQFKKEFSLLFYSKSENLHVRDFSTKQYVFIKPSLS